MTNRQYAQLKLFLCRGITCINCPFLESDIQKCKLNHMLFCENGVDPEVFAIVKKNKAYFNRCKELNSQYWDTIKNLFGATLK